MTIESSEARPSVIMAQAGLLQLWDTEGGHHLEAVGECLESVLAVLA